MASRTWCLTLGLGLLALGKLHNQDEHWLPMQGSTCKGLALIAKAVFLAYKGDTLAAGVCCELLRHGAGYGDAASVTLA